MKRKECKNEKKKKERKTVKHGPLVDVGDGVYAWVLS
jgi:hypothetical protein